MYTAFTSLSAQGQVILPVELREKLSLEEGAQFFLMSEGNNITLKPIRRSEKNEFFALLDKENAWAKDVGLTEKDILSAIKEVRASKK